MRRELISRCLDPRVNGKFSEASKVTGGGEQKVQLPDGNDWVLQLRKTNNRLRSASLVMNMAVNADYLERLERTKGKEFVPRLTLELGGDHAEWYLEDEKGFALLHGLYQKGIHSFGTHFHSNYKAGKHLWYAARAWGRSPQAYQRVT